jgi:protein-S-isoprenylcysteine O-methyltransferase
MRRLRPIHIAYILIGCFFAVERKLRQGPNATSLQGGPEDKGTTRAIGSAFGAAILIMLAAPALNRVQAGRAFGERAAWGGVAAMLAGMALRIWASRVLGAYYTRTLRTQQGQRIVREGPYLLVRHPGYLGDIVMWLGAGISTTNGLAAILIMVPLVRAYLLRVGAEEAMLARAFPQDYPDYARRTWRLIPLVY